MNILSSSWESQYELQLASKSHGLNHVHQKEGRKTQRSHLDKYVGCGSGVGGVQCCINISLAKETLFFLRKFLMFANSKFKFEELKYIYIYIHAYFFILSGVIAPLISSSILGTYQPGELIFHCHIFLPFHTVHWVLQARILKWFAIPFSS